MQGVFHFSITIRSIVSFVISLSTHCFLGFRLKATVLEVRNVSSKSACINVCFAHPCCRSMNYNHAISADQSHKCEFLHDLVENMSDVLEQNSLFHHIFFIKPLKVIEISNFKFLRIIIIQSW